MQILFSHTTQVLILYIPTFKTSLILYISYPKKRMRYEIHHYIPQILLIIFFSLILWIINGFTILLSTVLG